MPWIYALEGKRAPAAQSATLARALIPGQEGSRTALWSADHEGGGASQEAKSRYGFCGVKATNDGYRPLPVLPRDTKDHCVAGADIQLRRIASVRHLMNAAWRASDRIQRSLRFQSRGISPFPDARVQRSFVAAT